MLLIYLYTFNWKVFRVKISLIPMLSMACPCPAFCQPQYLSAEPEFTSSVYTTTAARLWLCFTELMVAVCRYLLHNVVTNWSLQSLQYNHSSTVSTTLLSCILLYGQLLLVLIFPVLFSPVTFYYCWNNYGFLLWLIFMSCDVAPVIFTFLDIQ